MLLHCRRERELAGAAAREAETRRQTPGKRWEEIVPTRPGLLTWTLLPQAIRTRVRAGARTTGADPHPQIRNMFSLWISTVGVAGDTRVVLSQSLCSQGWKQVSHQSQVM